MTEFLLGFLVIRASAHARQLIQSLLPAWQKIEDAPIANGKTKQVRKPNYIHEEITVLIEDVATNKVIVQSTLNSEVTNQQKGQLWQDIATTTKRKQPWCVRSNSRPSS